MFIGYFSKYFHYRTLIIPHSLPMITNAYNQIQVGFKTHLGISLNICFLTKINCLNLHIKARLHNASALKLRDLLCSFVAKPLMTET
jgi:hypothetical protein